MLQKSVTAFRSRLLLARYYPRKRAKSNSMSHKLQSRGKNVSQMATEEKICHYTKSLTLRDLFSTSCLGVNLSLFYLDRICSTLVWVCTKRLKCWILETKNKLGLKMLVFFFDVTKPNLQDFSLS